MEIRELEIRSSLPPLSTYKWNPGLPTPRTELSNKLLPSLFKARWLRPLAPKVPARREEALRRAGPSSEGGAATRPSQTSTATRHAECFPRASRYIWRHPGVGAPSRSSEPVPAAPADVSSPRRSQNTVVSSLGRRERLHLGASSPAQSWGFSPTPDPPLQIQPANPPHRAPSQGTETELETGGRPQGALTVHSATWPHLSS